MLDILVPTLVLWGMQDIALPPGLIDGLEDYIPDLTLQRVAMATPRRKCWRAMCNAAWVCVCHLTVVPWLGAVTSPRCCCVSGHKTGGIGGISQWWNLTKLGY
jgi:hypothetical protein